MKTFVFFIYSNQFATKREFDRTISLRKIQRIDTIDKIKKLF